MLAHDCEGDGACRCVLRQRGQLQFQAFGRRACADAGGLQVLQVLQRNAQFFRLDVEFRRQQFGQFFQRLGEIAVLIERFDEQGHQVAVTVGEVEQAQLRQQVLAQRG